MRTDLFDFELPEDRIALQPVSPRDAARLLTVRANGILSDRTVRDLPGLLRPGDALVFNDTRVIAAALSGVRVRGEQRAKVSFNLLRRVSSDTWSALARPAKKLQIGDLLRLGSQATSCSLGSLNARVSALRDAGEVELTFDLSGPDLDCAIDAAGSMPLPPYIAGKRAADARDRESYQTIYASNEGAVAAPTAGLHFTPDLMAAIEARGISRHFVTLHVGAGTFLPVKVEDTAGHKMHAEWAEVSGDTALALNKVRRDGGRIVAIGTTSLRLLESAVGEDGLLKPFRDETAIFITPGYRFKATDLLMTNFHLPRSTLFMLVAAFSGLETMKAAYAHAIASGYRFYSYGDACLLERR